MRILNQRVITPLSIRFEDELDTGYHPRFDSIGHQVLTSDKIAESIPDAIFQRLDTVISTIKNNISSISALDIQGAIQVLSSIECEITKQNFVCSIPYFLILSFAQGLHVQPLDPRVTFSPDNELRRPYLISHKNELFSHIDCDLGSLLYLSIAEVIGLPLCMVEVPQHNFVRWSFEDGSYLNWDTNYGFNKFSNEDYAANYRLKPEQVSNGTYLSNLSRNNTIGYFTFVRGLIFEKSRRFVDAAKMYRSAIQQYPQSPSPKNNLAWLFVISTKVQQSISGDDAIRLATEACELHDSDNQLDTLACVLAQCGKFDEAIKIETKAYSINPNPQYNAMISAFTKGKTWMDINGDQD